LGALSWVLFCGCTSWKDYIHNGYKVGPEYQRPVAPLAKQWIDANDSAVSAARAAQGDSDQWWCVFNDPILTGLIADAAKQNVDLRTACWRMVEARTQRDIVAGSLFPQTQQLNAAYQRRAISETQRNVFRQQRFFDQFDVGATLAWELDFWGGFRRAVESADATFEASVENYHGALILLLANVAGTYAQIRTLDEQLDAARRNVAIEQGSLEIAKDRFRNGVTTQLDVEQATSILDQTQAAIPLLEISRRQAANQLCVLLGHPPADIEKRLGGRRAIPLPPPQVVIGIPADLLCRRPDIRSAERAAAAQSAQIGVADANLYPHISINGTIGFQSSNFSQLFDQHSLAGNVGPSFQWNVLNYGRLANNVKLQDAKFQELAYQYQSTVLAAEQEAENALTAFLKSQVRVTYVVQGVDATKRSVDLALAQYQEGTVGFDRVYVLEQTLAQLEDQAASSQGAVAQNLILLYRALGGGWQTPACAPCPVQESTTRKAAAGETSGKRPAAKGGSEEEAGKVPPRPLPAAKPQAEKPIEKPIEKPVEEPAEKPIARPSEKLLENPPEKPLQEPQAKTEDQRPKTQDPRLLDTDASNDRSADSAAAGTVNGKANRNKTEFAEPELKQVPVEEPVKKSAPTAEQILLPAPQPPEIKRLPPVTSRQPSLRREESPASAKMHKEEPAPRAATKAVGLVQQRPNSQRPGIAVIVEEQGSAPLAPIPPPVPMAKVVEGRW
jgi:NodT family efflux transporter outer membrane factor (OMF) lipoprotein